MATCRNINILTDLLDDARSEIKELQAQNDKFVLAVDNLQSRLARLGADTSVDLADHELFLPGHDKKFLQHLIDDNLALKRASKITVEEYQKQEREISNLEGIVQNLRKKDEANTKEINELKTFIKTEDKSKIYFRQLDQVSQCTSKLKDAELVLSSLAKTVRIKANQIHGLKRHSNKLEEILKGSDKIRILKEQRDQLEKENGQLSNQLKEVIRMNINWQEYDGQREAYVMKLARTVKSLEEKISKLETLLLKAHVTRMDQLETMHKIHIEELRKRDSRNKTILNP